MKRKRGAGLEPLLGIFRNSEYHVILYAKSGPFWRTAPPDELPVRIYWPSTLDIKTATSGLFLRRPDPPASE